MSYRRVALAVAGALVVAFAAGRYTARQATEVEERVVHTETVVTKTRVVAQRAETKHVVVYRDRVVEPDGTTIEREVERADTETRETTRTDSAVDVEKATDSTKVVRAPLPDWRVGALVGAQLRLPPEGPIFGAIVERRIAGPLSVGAWGLQTGAAGLVVTLEF